MLWLRRSLAIILIPVFILLFIVALLLIRANSTVLSAGFYVDQLRSADIFAFMYDEAAPVALKEESNKETQRIPINLEKVGNKGVSLLREVFPPSWLEEQTEQVILQVLPYVVGDEDTFSVHVNVADRIRTLGDVLKREIGSDDTYTLLIDDVIAPALNDTFADNPQLADLPLSMSLASEAVVATVRELVPPEWAETWAEHVVDQVVPYLTGESEHFAINVPVSDRIEATGPALKKLLVNAKAYEVLRSQEFIDAVEDQLDDFGPLPFGMTLTSAQIVKAIQDMAPPQWLQLSTEAILDAVVPYLAGKQDHFEVLVPTKDRIQLAVPVVKTLMQNVGAYTLLFDEVVAKLVTDNLGQQLVLPLGLTVTSDHIVPVLRTALPPEFIQQQSENMIDQVAPYLTGDSTTFTMVVPLADQKTAALVAIQGLVDKKLNEAVAMLPPCTVNEALDLVQTGFIGSLPHCLPKGYTLAEIKQALVINIPDITLPQIEQQLGISLTILTEGVTAETIKSNFGIDVAGQVGNVIGDAIPNEFVFTDSDLRNVLGANDEEKLNTVLTATRNGYKFTDADLLQALNDYQTKSWDSFLNAAREGVTYTDANLREDTGVDNQETLDQVLEMTRNGVSFTETELREAIGDSQLSQFDAARTYLSLARSLWFLLLLAPGALLASIGFLGGKSWRGRLTWAATPLFIGAAFAYAAFGPAYSIIVQPFLDDAFTNLKGEATGVALMMAEKGTSVTQAALKHIVSSLAIQALVLLIVSVVALAVAILWPKLFNRAKAEKAQT